MQYFFTLSPASIHEILEPGEWEYQYWEEVEVTSDEWEIHLKGPAPPGPLKEGPDERYQYPCEQHRLPQPATHDNLLYYS